MSVIYHIKKEGISDNVRIPGTEISSQELHRLLAEKLGVSQGQIIITNPITGQKFTQIQMIKDKYSVNVQKIISNDPSSLSIMVSKARFFMIKSSNEENIQKARDQSIWATTLSNQDKLKSAFLYYSHVFLFFATNRSYELKGLARMENQPAKNPDKSCWAGVSNIRLGGNFKIKWVRKTPLTALQIQKELGPVIKDRIMRLSDGQQIDGQICKKISLLFELPTSPYYEPKQELVQKKEIDKRIPNLVDILGKQVPLNFNYPIISHQFFLPPNATEVKQENDKIQIKENQSKNKKTKKKRRSYSSESSSESSSDSSSYHRRRRSKSKKKQKKRRRRRSSESSSSSSNESRSRSRRKREKKDKKHKSNRKDKKNKYKERKERKKERRYH